MMMNRSLRSTVSSRNGHPGPMASGRRRVEVAQPEWSNLLTEGQLAGVDHPGDEASAAGAPRTPCRRGLEILTEGQLAGVNATISARRPMKQSLSVMEAPASLLVHQVEGKPSLVSSRWARHPRPCPPRPCGRACLDEPDTPMHAVSVEPTEIAAVGDVCNFGVPVENEVCLRRQLEDARKEAGNEGVGRGEHALELGDTRTNMIHSQKQERLCSPPPIPSLPFLSPPAEVSC